MIIEYSMTISLPEKKIVTAIRKFFICLFFNKRDSWQDSGISERASGETKSIKVFCSYLVFLIVTKARMAYSKSKAIANKKGMMVEDCE